MWLLKKKLLFYNTFLEINTYKNYVARKLNQTNRYLNYRVLHNYHSLLWPKSIKYDNVLLFVSDALHSYSWKLDSIILFKNDTCHLYVLHRFAEEIRKHFLNRNKSIANGKNYLKGHFRVK